MYPFDYHRCNDVDEASTLLESLEDAKFLAGGQSLLPMMKLRFAQTGNILDLRDIPDLRGITIADDDVTIGALTRHADVGVSAELRAVLPALADLAGGIGDPQVRAQGTIGGSVANNDPSADYPAACLALDATIITSQREISADDFFTGVFETTLEDAELITAVQFRIPNQACYIKFRHPASRFALVGVFVARFGTTVRVAVTGAGSQGVFRWIEAETALTAAFTPQSVAGLAPDIRVMNSDIHADAEYRAHLTGVLLRRGVSGAISRVA
jgi:carbon-monoxide dehydrogenase medium subunit